MIRSLPILKMLVLAAGLFASHAAVDASGADAQACVTNMFSGVNYGSCAGNNVRPIKIVRLQKSNAYATYMVSGIYKTSAAGTTMQANGDMLFSDRMNGSQPFDYTQEDSFRFTITSAGAITMENLTWGTSASYTAGCSNNMITASSSSVFYLITYGSVTTSPC